MFSRFLTVSFLSLALPLAAWANPHGVHHNHHAEVAKRQSSDVQLHKRFSQARWSFYDVGLGACGEYSVENEFIVALNTPQYGGGYPGPNCFKTITMTYNGKTTQAKIMDQCPGCPFGGLDLSRGLFKFFAAESVGIIYGEWHFNDGSEAPAPAPAPAPPKETTTKKWVTPTPTWKPEPKPEPTTTWKPEPTTTWTPEPEPTTSSTKKSSSSSSPPPTTSKTSSSTSSSSTSRTSTSSSAPAVTPTLGPQNLAGINQIVLNVGGVIVAGAAV
ncbi:Allergen Asp f 7 [Hypsizygus marmoreus]|uniref:Allergen Asp f 7 n=1 Tax=Hypsizygus marmoreus TaxID=39966 RepID=A0A369JWP5_HYPMA|nr:Allergen Asp f 7 [Hypsizygus marmoreus]